MLTLLGDVGGVSAIVGFFFHYLTYGVAKFRLSSILAKVLYKEESKQKETKINVKYQK